MAKFRKKPVVIDAVQFDPHKHPWPDGVVSWKEAGYQPRDMSWGYIETLEGKMHVMNGDWIITGVAGEKYPCKPDIFVATYDPTEAVGLGSATVQVEHMGKTYEGVVYEVKNG